MFNRRVAFEHTLELFSRYLLQDTFFYIREQKTKQMTKTSTYLMIQMDTVRPITRLSIMHNISHQVIHGALIFGLHLRGQYVAKIHVFHREIHNRRVLFDKERVLGEPLDVENEIGRKRCDFESLEEVLLVGFVLLLRLVVELGQDCVQVDLRGTEGIKIQEFGPKQLFY